MVQMAICDDDQIFLDHAMDIVHQTAYSLSVSCEVSGFSKSDVLLSQIEEDVHRFDVYIIDMEMPNVHGFELLKAIKEISPVKPVMILTSHNSYAVDAIDYQVLRYIPKEELNKRIAPALAAAFKEIRSYKYIMITNERELHKVYFYEIVYITKSQKYSVMHLFDGRQLTKRTSLEDLLSELDESFLYANRGCIFNLAYISSIDGHYLRLKTNESIKISPNNLSNVKQAVYKYIRTIF